MKVLIAGGCGFIGSNLAIYLKKKKVEVVSVDNLFRKGSFLNKQILKKNKIRNINIDIKNLHRIKLKKFDLIIDCCAEPSVEVSKKDLDRVMFTNLIGTYNLIKKVISDKSAFIFLSTSRVYSISKIKKIFKNMNLKNEIKLKKEFSENFSTETPRSFYGFTKLASEELIKELAYIFNYKYIINRLGVIAGPGQMGKVDQGFISLWIWRHLNKIPIKYIGFGGHGNQVRDVLHINDLNELIFKQIKNIKNENNFILPAGGGLKNLISLKKLTSLCENITGNKIKITKHKKTSSYDIPYFCSSNSKAMKLYKWKPKLSIIDIVRDTFNWQNKNHKVLKKFLD